VVSAAELLGKDEASERYLALASVPVPAALPLFAGGLDVLGVFGWREPNAWAFFFSAQIARKCRALEAPALGQCRLG
jgi:hypothetical protein